MKNILSLRHFLLLFLSVTLISCAGDDDGDDANGGRTTDPIIGSWRVVVDGGGVLDLTFTSNGNYNGGVIFEDAPEDNDTFMGTWSNNGTVFSSTRQIYTFTEDGTTSTVNATYSEDFNSVTFSDIDIDGTFIRQ